MQHAQSQIFTFSPSFVGGHRDLDIGYESFKRSSISHCSLLIFRRIYTRFHMIKQRKLKKYGIATTILCPICSFCLIDALGIVAVERDVGPRQIVRGDVTDADHVLRHLRERAHHEDQGLLSAVAIGPSEPGESILVLVLSKGCKPLCRPCFKRIR